MKIRMLVLASLLGVGCVAESAPDAVARVQEEVALARELAASDPIAARVELDDADALLEELDAEALQPADVRAILHAEVDAARAHLDAATLAPPPDEVHVQEAPLCATHSEYLHQYIGRFWYCDPPPSGDTLSQVRLASAAGEASATGGSATSSSATRTLARVPSPFCRWLYYATWAIVECDSSCFDVNAPDTCSSSRPEALETFDPDSAELLEQSPIDCRPYDPTTCGISLPGDTDDPIIH